MRKLAWLSVFAMMWCSGAAAQEAIYYWMQDGISSYSDSPPSSETGFGEHYVGPVYEVETDAPITDDDQSDARYAEMEAQQQPRQVRTGGTYNRQACYAARTTYAKCRAVVSANAKIGPGRSAMPPSEVVGAQECMATSTAEIGQYCH
jgi:hypothetical protein